MVDVEIEEEGDPEICELRSRIAVLEQQQQMLTKALLANSLGYEVCLKKHANFRRAVKRDFPVRIQLTLDEGLVKLDYVVELDAAPILRVESVHSIRGRGTVHVCEYLRRDVPVRVHDKLRSANFLWELIGVELIGVGSGVRDSVGLVLKPVDHGHALAVGCELSLA